MKRIVGLLSLLLILSACGKEGDYKIKGTVDSDLLDGKEIQLVRYNNAGVLSSQSVTVKNKKFTIKGNIFRPAVYYLLSDQTNTDLDGGIAFYLAEGEIPVSVVGRNVSVGGNSANDDYQQLREAQRASWRELEALSEQYGARVEANQLSREEQVELGNKMDDIYSQLNKITADYVADHIRTPLGEEVFILSMSLLTADDADRILANATNVFKTQPEIQQLMRSVAFEKRLGAGKPFIDFTLPDKDGKQRSLSDYAGKGKYVLLQFWASWCGPCLGFMPDLRRIYDEYKGKGLEIVSVSVDTDRTAWLQAVKNLKLPWPQLGDGSGSTQVGGIYGVQNIPHLVLIDREGNMITHHLTSQEVEERLKALLD